MTTTELPILYTAGTTPFLAVAEALAKDFRFVFGNAAIGNGAKDLGAEVANLDEAVDMPLLAQAQAAGLWLYHQVAGELIHGKLTNLSPDYPPLHTPLIQGWMPNAVYEPTVFALSKILAITRIIEEHGIQGVLLHEDVSIDGRVLAGIGHKYEVPVVHLPHANYFISPTDGDIHASSRSDILGVYGPYMRDWFIAAGVDPSTITMIGAAHWDKMYNESERLTKEHSRACLGVGMDRPVYAYAASWAQDTNAWGRGAEDLFDSLRWVLETVREANAQLIIKLHPHQNEQNVLRAAEIVTESGVGTVFTSHYAAHILKAADVVITQGSSNIAVEAGIMGTPVVEMFQPGTRYPAKYNIPGTWGSKLPDAIDTAIDEGVNEEFLADMNMGPGSTERMRAFVLEQFGVIDKD